MNKIEITIFAFPSVAPLSRCRPRILLGFNLHLYGLDLTSSSSSSSTSSFFFFFFLMGPHVMIFLVDLLRRLHFSKGLPRRLLNGWRRFADPASRPYK